MRVKKTPDKTKPSTGEIIKVRHDFTTEEWRDKSNQLLKLLRDCDVKKDERKAQAAVMKAAVDQLQSQAKDVASQLDAGYEMRDVQALVEYHPKDGLKKYFYECPGQAEHGTFIRQEIMTQDDYALANAAAQPELPNTNTPPAPAEPPKEKEPKQ